MTKSVQTWNSKTGARLPNLVPQSWIDRGTFPHLTTTEPGRRTTKAAKGSQKQEEG